ncbi:phytanoyl-CoA dioxygenase family protein [Endozoicomonas sp. SCSIO W0465]|uniref:phytanoyl-CoA dioxygenase family protein n=1 Tax=Endozoicomonas sp. SCSIO W0465 TaxID=2918516 RepID=UPI002074B737|nr:phytanoyl-CoA dioxygenase family protein [Endozoicomonas sp. SCSIO W0465]USE34900.1 phytanoyl-CoA dioxygenase family protein [Endozoicomonas sp. SCSIO W0465]
MNPLAHPGCSDNTFMDIRYTHHRVHDGKLADPKDLKKAFVEQGYIVVGNVSTATDRDNAVSLLQRQVKQYPEASINGFFELYHDDVLAQLRQNPTMVKLFEALWDTRKLWVVFDRCIYMRPETDQNGKLPLHVDQNPHTQPGFSSVQGLLALRDCDKTTGMLGIIPGSHHDFAQYKSWSDDQQGWIEYQGDDVPTRWQALRAVHLKEGEIVVWDSRLTHSRFNADPGCTEKWNERMLAMISFLPASANETLRARRVHAIESGTGQYDHQAGLRKTAGSHMPSLRVTPENLTKTGKQIYGIEPW